MERDLEVVRSYAKCFAAPPLHLRGKTDMPSGASEAILQTKIRFFIPELTSAREFAEPKTGRIHKGSLISPFVLQAATQHGWNQW